MAQSDGNFSHRTNTHADTRFFKGKSFQIIPLPEVNYYQVQVREKEQQGKKKRVERYDERLRFWEGLIAVASTQKTRQANIKPGSYHWLGASPGFMSRRDLSRHGVDFFQLPCATRRILRD